MLSFKFNDKIIYKDHGNMLLAFNAENGDTYEFDEIGAEIFRLVTKNIGYEEILNILKAAYSEEYEDQIRNDLNDFLERLLKINVIISGND